MQPYPPFHRAQPRGTLAAVKESIYFAECVPLRWCRVLRSMSTCILHVLHVHTWRQGTRTGQMPAALRDLDTLGSYGR